MNNEWYIDRFADSIDDEEYIKEYQNNFKDDVKKIFRCRILIKERKE